MHVISRNPTHSIPDVELPIARRDVPADDRDLTHRTTARPRGVTVPGFHAGPPTRRLLEPE
ncbi:hypothetical protein OG948_53305 (plasmid) [Embleya sp. NBC_00888]|uniref:hypothetical protein n=1 Tax=Embleya sp. NBC_00888 TaxID=2975960 RepID=UPI00386DEB4A|nr:hypothetical protein OG948_53305 [Embleya sp. NBC_00888]